MCESEQDYDTRMMLTRLLDDTEMDHAYWLEKQLGLIKKVGLKTICSHRCTPAARLSRHGLPRPWRPASLDAVFIFHPSGLD